MESVFCILNYLGPAIPQLVEWKRGNWLQIFRKGKHLVYESHEYPFWENTRLQAWECPEQGLYDIAKVKYGLISHNYVSREPHVVMS